MSIEHCVHCAAPFPLYRKEYIHRLVRFFLERFPLNRSLSNQHAIVCTCGPNYCPITRLCRRIPRQVPCPPLQAAPPSPPLSDSPPPLQPSGQQVPPFLNPKSFIWNIQPDQILLWTPELRILTVSPRWRFIILPFSNTKFHRKHVFKIISAKPAYF